MITKPLKTAWFSVKIEANTVANGLRLISSVYRPVLSVLKTGTVPVLQSLSAPSGLELLPTFHCPACSMLIRD
jgi:hypothetical protein